MILAGTDSSAVETDNRIIDLMPAVILSHPQMGENIGAAARAMKNCGFSRLLLVAPRDGWPNPDAEAMAAGGADLLKSAEVYGTTAEAAADCTMLLATTARRRDMPIHSITPREAAKAIIDHAQSGGRPALLFGAERSGLTNDEVAMADSLVTAPLNPAFSSLNLAQAVLLMGWECRMEAGRGLKNLPGQYAQKESGPATLSDREFFYDTLEQNLTDGGFFANPEIRPVIMRNIKTLFNKAKLTEQEVRTLHGMIKAVRRAGKLDK